MMKPIGSVPLPGHDEEVLAIDPVTHTVYQNVPDKAAFVIIDPHTLRVTKIVKTPTLVSDHPLQYDAALHQIVVGGKNGIIAAYTTSGTFLGQTRYPKDVDQCSLDRERALIACAGHGVLATLALHANAAPTLLATRDLHNDAHTVGVDSKTGTMWTVWSQPDSDRVAGFSSGGKPVAVSRRSRDAEL